MKGMKCFYSEKMDRPKLEMEVKSGKMAIKNNKDGSIEFYDPKVYSIKNGKYIPK